MAAGLVSRVPTYVWTFLALVAGLAAGGFFPGPLAPVADATATLIAWVVAVVPLLKHTTAQLEYLAAAPEPETHDSLLMSRGFRWINEIPFNR